jgi:hypothetical protein
MEATYCFETLVHIYHIPGHPNINGAYYLSTLNTETAIYFETLVPFYQITRRHIAESSNLGNHRRVNLSAGEAMDIRMMSNYQLLKESVMFAERAQFIRHCWRFFVIKSRSPLH